MNIRFQLLAVTVLMTCGIEAKIKREQKQASPKVETNALFFIVRMNDMVFMLRM